MHSARVGISWLDDTSTFKQFGLIEIKEIDTIQYNNQYFCSAKNTFRNMIYKKISNLFTKYDYSKMYPNSM